MSRQGRCVLYIMIIVKTSWLVCLFDSPLSMAVVVNVEAGRGVLQHIGEFGIYQKFLCVVVVGTISGLCALSFATQIFSLITPDHWCWNSDIAALEEQLPLARVDTKKFSIPVISTGRLPWSVEAPLVSFSQCQRYDGDLAGAYVGWVAAKKPSNHIPVTPGNSTKYPVRGCDHGWIYNHTFRTLTTENNWVCNSKWKPYALHTAFWVGASVGAFISGHIANSFGRRIPLIAGMLLCFLGGVLTLATSGFILLLTSRFVIGLGHLTTSYMALTIVLELCNEQHQAIPLLVMMMAHTTATLMSPWVAHGVTTWWWLTLIPTALSGAVCFMLLWVVPESLWWMLITDRHENAIQLLQRIAKVNIKEHLHLNHIFLKESHDLWSRNRRSPKICCLGNNSNSRNNLLESEWLHCFSCRKGFIIINILWMLCGLCYYGNYYTCVNLVSTALGRRSDPSDTFVSYGYAALMEIPIWILPFILQGRLQVCQVALIVSLVCAAVLSICYAILPTGYVALSLALGLMTRFAVAVAYYTTVQRRWEMNNIFDKISTARTESPMGLAVAVVPSIVYMGEYYSQIPSLVFGIVASVAAVVSLFLPAHMAKFHEINQYKPIHRLRKIQLRKQKKPSVLSTENQNEDATHTASTVPYNLLEST